MYVLGTGNGGDTYSQVWESFDGRRENKESIKYVELNQLDFHLSQ